MMTHRTQSYCFFIGLVVGLLWWTHTGYAEESVAETASAETFVESVMNDIKLSDYPNFPDIWKLVTVRYRTDTHEMRFVYANPAAYAALLAGGKDYPDGAVFGKVGVMTEDDPAFISSKVPSGVQRFQIMLRHKTKYAETGGWGYAVFGAAADAKIAATDLAGRNKRLAEDTQACFACHQMVEQRNYVFSLPADLKTSYRLMQAKRTPAAAVGAALVFTDRAVAALPELVRTMLPKTIQKVRFLEGSLRRHVFIGTFGELRPSLVREVEQSNLPAIFMSEDETKFAMVVPEHKTALPDGTACPSGQKLYSNISNHEFSNIERFFCN